MSVLGTAETAIETVTGARWWRLALKLAPFVAIVGLAIALQLTRATLERVRLEHQVADAKRDAAAANQRAGWIQRWGAAADAYATRSAALKPIILHSRDEMTTYAQTPAGAVLCRDADRVRRIDQLDASLVDTGAAGDRDRAVPSDTPTTPAGR